MKFGGSTPFQEQNVRRQESLVTPLTFSVAIGAGSTAIYASPANRDEYFLLRKFVVVNDTAGPINFELQANSVVWVPSVSIASKSAVEEEGLAGMLVEPGEDLTATGQNLRVVGWGVRVQGGDGWAL